MRKFLIVLAIFAAGCTLPGKAPPPAAPAAPAGPTKPFEAWDVTGARLELRIYREGPMEKLGHNHVIVSTALQGTIEMREPMTDSGFRLELPLESFTVDEPEARKAAGPDFAQPVPDKDREATRTNMLGPSVLDAARQPVITLAIDALEGGPAEYQARVRVGLRGEERVVAVPVAVTVEGGKLTAHAKFTLRHAELGLTPFTVGLGALRVRDAIDFDCRIEAKRRSAA